MIRRLGFGTTVMIGLSLTVGTLASAGPLPLWQLESDHNRVFIMGSIHFLRPADYPLRDGLQNAYALSDKLLMELDPGALDPMAAQTTIARLAIDPQGRKLPELLGQNTYREASERAAALTIPINLFNDFEPWFAALSITQLRMQQLGFDPAWGVESWLSREALQDGKSVTGLESLEQQLRFMDELRPLTQQKFLLQSLEDAISVEKEVDDIVAAWQAGDINSLQELLLNSMEEAPELYEAILVQRNRNWLEPVAKLLTEDQDYLVIVGTLHLVGDDSLLAMLEARGISAQQLSDEDMRRLIAAANSTSNQH